MGYGLCDVMDSSLKWEIEESIPDSSMAHYNHYAQVPLGKVQFHLFLQQCVK